MKLVKGIRNGTIKINKETKPFENLYLLWDSTQEELNNNLTNV